MLFADAFEDSETSKLDWEVNSVFACAAVRMMQTLAMMSVQDVPGWGTRRRRERHCWETFGDVFDALTEPEPSENGRSLDVAARTQEVNNTLHFVDSAGQTVPLQQLHSLCP
jgi:hypothetical protein